MMRMAVVMILRTRVKMTTRKTASEARAIPIHLVLGERYEELHINHIFGQRQGSIQGGYDYRIPRIPNSRIPALNFHLNPETMQREYQKGEA
jgi:hypothetical protein